jgi:hypothetical protein
MKYQLKLKREVAELYQSNDPLRWVYLANKLNVDRQMTPREFRIFKKRMFATFKRMGVVVADAFKAITGAVSKAAESLATMVAAMSKIKNDQPAGAITVHRLPHAETINVRIAPTIGGLATAPIIGNVSDLKIHVDEALHLDDETMERVQKAVEKAENRG